MEGDMYRLLNKIKRCSPQRRIKSLKSSAMANTFVRLIFYSRKPGIVKRKEHKKSEFSHFAQEVTVRTSGN
ncbi:MAG: hypothetical protein ACLR6L_06625 [Agathobaculum sp.]